MAIQARTTEWELPEEVGEVVHVSPKKGFRCVNKEQPPGKTCSNYHIRFLCPLGECLSPPRPTPPGPHWHVEGCPYPLLCPSPPSPYPTGRCQSWGCTRAPHPAPAITPRVHNAGHRPGSWVRVVDPQSTPLPLPEHIYWSHWSSWSPCSRSACGTSGTQTRTRRCVNARLVTALKELKCKGKAVERRPCSAGPCPGRDPAPPTSTHLPPGYLQLLSQWHQWSHRAAEVQQLPLRPRGSSAGKAAA